MHMSPGSIAIHDYQESMTTGQTVEQTDARQSEPYMPLCFEGDTKAECQNLQKIFRQSAECRCEVHFLTNEIHV